MCIVSFERCHIFVPDFVRMLYILCPGRLDLPDFYFTGDDYRYRLEPEAKQRFIELIRERFNAGISYNGRSLRWDTVIEHKTNELGRFLAGKSIQLGFGEPAPILQREDDREFRAKILALTSSQAKQLGIGKSTLHYLRRNSKSQRTLKLYKPVRAKLELQIEGAS